MIIYPQKITAEQMVFSFEFSLEIIILHLAELFKIWKKILKSCVPSIPFYITHKQVNNTCVRKMLVAMT